MSDRLEQDVRDLLVRRAGEAVVPPGAAGRAIAGAGRRRRTRQALLVGAAVSVVAIGTGLLTWSAETPAEVVAPAVQPLPDVPAVPLYSPATGELRDWPAGSPRTRDLAGAEPLAAVPGGVLALTPSGASLLLLADDDLDLADATTLAEELAAPSVAVSSDGRRVTVVAGAGPSELREVEVRSGQVLRSLPLVGPVAPQPVAYSGGAVLLGAGESTAGQVLLWEEGDDGVLSALDGLQGVLGGADADLGSRAVGGRAAFEVAGTDCPVEVRELRDGDGSPWALCGEDFLGFSPDGGLVLASARASDELVVRDADGGTELARLGPATGDAAVWETDGTTLQPTAEVGGTVVVRCVVASDRCSELVTVAGDGPVRPLPRFGG